MKDEKEKPGFTLSHTRDREYWHTEIRIFPEPNNSCHDGRIVIKWQSNTPNSIHGTRDGDDGEWRLYGQRCEMGFDTMEQFKETTKLFQSLFGHLGRPREWNEPDTKGFHAHTVLEVLAGSKKIRQMVYDGRESKYLTLAEVKPPEWASYRDDYEKVNYGGSSYGCTVGCMAPNVDEARRLLTIAFAGNTYRAERFDQWIAAGRPVMKLHHSEALEILKVEDALKHFLEAAARRQAVIDKENAEAEAKRQAEIIAEKSAEGEQVLA